MKVAFIHDWLVTYRGGEKVLEALLELYPEAPIYTLFYDPTKMPESIRKRDVRYPKLLNRFRSIRKAFLPLFPAIIESFPLFDYDLLISTSSCVAKGAVGGPEGKHLCYLHSPMRYVWDQRDQYLKGLKKIPMVGGIIHLLNAQLRLWDVVSASRVDTFVANSHFVSQRAKRYYGRDSIVIPPPIDIKGFTPKSKAGGDYFLVAGAMVPYKRFDIAIKACEQLGVPLVVAGSGPLEGYLRGLGGKSTRFEISPDDRRWGDLMKGAKALLFPGVEDFGMVPLEAMSSGTPVIAFKKGGALDYIVPGKTGVFFEDQSVESLVNALKVFTVDQFVPSELHEFARGFCRESFLGKIKNEIGQLLERPS